MTSKGKRTLVGIVRDVIIMVLIGALGGAIHFFVYGFSGELGRNDLSFGLLCVVSGAILVPALMGILMTDETGNQKKATRLIAKGLIGAFAGSIWGTILGVFIESPGQVLFTTGGALIGLIVGPLITKRWVFRE